MHMNDCKNVRGTQTLATLSLALHSFQIQTLWLVVPLSVCQGIKLYFTWYCIQILKRIKLQNEAEVQEESERLGVSVHHPVAAASKIPSACWAGAGGSKDSAALLSLKVHFYFETLQHVHSSEIHLWDLVRNVSFHRLHFLSCNPSCVWNHHLFPIKCTN